MISLLVSDIKKIAKSSPSTYRGVHDLPMCERQTHDLQSLAYFETCSHILDKKSNWSRIWMKQPMDYNLLLKRLYPFQIVCGRKNIFEVGRFPNQYEFLTFWSGFVQISSIQVHSPNFEFWHQNMSHSDQIFGVKK